MSSSSDFIWSIQKLRSSFFFAILSYSQSNLSFLTSMIVFSLNQPLTSFSASAKFTQMVENSLYFSSILLSFYIDGETLQTAFFACSSYSSTSFCAVFCFLVSVCRSISIIWRTFSCASLQTNNPFSFYARASNSIYA